MAEALILDSEALNALAQPRERKVLAARAATVLRFAFDRRALVRVPAPVMAEVSRGTRFDSAVNHLYLPNSSPPFGLGRRTHFGADYAR